MCPPPNLFVTHISMEVLKPVTGRSVLCPCPRHELASTSVCSATAGRGLGRWAFLGTESPRIFRKLRSSQMGILSFHDLQVFYNIYLRSGWGSCYMTLSICTYSSINFLIIAFQVSIRLSFYYWFINALFV